MLQYYTVNMAGPYHIDNGLPCQDSYCVKRDEGGVVYASAADGLGSESHSDDGSRIASQRSCAFCMEHYQSGMPFSDVKKIMNNAFVNAYKAVLEAAQAAGNSADEYDTTLCLVIFDNGHVFYGQSGDSGIIALMQSGEYVPLTTQQRDEDGYVFPLCSGPEMWDFGEVEAPVASVMLMTDGVWEQLCPPVLRNHEVNVNVALASRFMDRQENSIEAVKALEDAATSFLENYPRRLLDDDKTVVVIYNPLQPAAKLTEEYYNAPDWTALQEAAKAQLYKDLDLHEQADDEYDMPDGSAGKDSDNLISEDGIVVGDIGPPISSAEGHLPCNTPSSIHDADPVPTKCGQHTIRLLSALGGNIYDLLSVLLLAAFSVLAFAMSGFVKAHAPETYLGVLIVCFIANSTVLLPAPSILVVIQYSMILNPLAVALIGAVGASLGEMVGFLTGVHSRSMIGSKLIDRIEDRFPEHPYILVLAFSALPLPLFDIVGMLAGAIRMDKFKFFLTCLVGKFSKMLMFVWISQIGADCFLR